MDDKNLDDWIMDVLQAINVADTLDAEYNLHLSKDEVKHIASEFRRTEWIEIY